MKKPVRLGLIAVLGILAIALALHAARRHTAWSRWAAEARLSSGGPVAFPRPADFEIRAGDSLVFGQVELSYHGSEGLPDWFYMALMVLPESGEPVVDFFGDQRVADGDELKAGVCLRQDVPTLRRGGLDEDIKSFATDFPEYLDKDFSLTFRRFDGQKYWLWNVSEGRGYIWFQTSFDGYRVTQLPICVEFKPEPGAAVRVDLLDIDFSRTFFTL